MKNKLKTEHLSRPARVFLVSMIVLLAAISCSPAPTRTPVPSGEVVQATSSPQPRRTRTPAALTRTPTPAVTSALGVSPDDLEGVRIAYWHPWTAEPAEIISQLVQEFNEDNPWGIQASERSFSGFDRLEEGFLDPDEEQSTPDLIVAYPYQALNWEGNRTSFVDLEAYAEDPEWGFSPDEQGDFYPVFWEQDIVEGRRVGIPAQRSAAVLYYNQSWAKELGFPAAPKDPTQFRMQACGSFRANASDNTSENDGSGGWIITSGYAETLAWLYAFDHEVLAPTSRGYRFDSDASEATFTFLRELYENNCAWLPEENSIPDGDFASRGGLFVAGTVGGLRTQEAAFREAGNADTWRVLPFPGPDEQAAITVYGPSFEILETTDAQQLAAWLLVKWLSAPENQARLIEASGTLPVRKSVLDHIDPQYTPLEQWQQAVDLLEYARPEPNYASWYTVRWAVADVATQLFRWYFTLDQLPATIELLDDTAVQIHREGK